MRESHVQLLEYVREDGRNPFRDWLLGLDDRMARARIRARLNRLRLGNFGDCKSVGKGVHELRVAHGPGYRAYFGQHAATVVILLCGGVKSSQARDIRTARAYWKDYLGRTHRG
jgi:putative addiction module killer protein